MECKKGDYICVAGDYYCLRPGTDCPHRDYARVREIQIQYATSKTDDAYNGCNLAQRIEQVHRSTDRFHTIR